MSYYIYLRRGKCYKKLARVDKSAKTITGSIWNIFPAQYHTNVKEIHFTYPMDGDYHVSATMNDGTNLKIFSDRGARKSKNKKWEKIPKEEATAMVPMAMVPGYKALPFAGYVTTDKSFFPIMTMGMGRLDIFDVENPKTKDFVIDCDNVDVARTPNFALMIIGKDSDPYASMKLEFIGKKIFFNDYPKVFAGLFYGR